jgi:hypothetical protein
MTPVLADPHSIPAFLCLTSEERRASWVCAQAPLLSATEQTTAPVNCEPTRLETWKARGDYSPRDLAFIEHHEAATRAKQQQDKEEGLAQLTAWKAAQPPKPRRSADTPKPPKRRRRQLKSKRR